MGCGAGRSGARRIVGWDRPQRRSARRAAPLRWGDRRRRTRAYGHIVADRLCRRRDARRGNRARLAGAGGQAGPDARTRSRRGLLSNGLVLAADAMIGRCLGLLLGSRDIAAAELPVPQRRVVEIVAAFILTAVAAHALL